MNFIIVKVYLYEDVFQEEREAIKDILLKDSRLGCDSETKLTLLQILFLM
jgi:hypothetical protein